MRDTHHLVGNLDIRVEGPTAHAEAYVHANHVIHQTNTLVQLTVGARYLMRFSQRQREWRISYQTEVLDWGRWIPIPEDWFEKNNEMTKGERGRTDLSYGF